MKVHLITHTHWDREWYRTFQEFRIFLVYLLDDLVDYLEKVPAYESFMLDGQTVQLQDYLEVRPENLNRLREQVQAGKLIENIQQVNEALIENIHLFAVYEIKGSKKVGYYVPGTKIPILPEADLFSKKHFPDVIINLAWHIPAEVCANLSAHGYKGKIINIKDFPVKK